MVKAKQVVNGCCKCGVLVRVGCSLFLEQRFVKASVFSHAKSNLCCVPPVVGRNTPEASGVL